MLLCADTFGSALKLPFNLISAPTIALTLIFLQAGWEKTTLIAIFLGLAADYNHNSWLGLTSMTALLALGSIYLLKNTILSGQNYISIFLLILAFNLSYFLIYTLITLKINVFTLQEMATLIAINTTIAFIALVVIKTIKQQLGKRFI